MVSIRLDKEQAERAVHRKLGEAGKSVVGVLAFALPTAFEAISHITVEDQGERRFWRCHFLEEEEAVHFLLRWT